MQLKHISIFLCVFLLIGVVVACSSNSDIVNENKMNSQEVSIIEDDESMDEDNEIELEPLVDLEDKEYIEDKNNSEKPASNELIIQANVQGVMTVHFIDVGQADATLFIGPDFTVLVDAGRHDRSDIVPYLQKVGVKHIDLLVGTHPHADHIGQFDKVINSFTISEVWMDGNTHTTRTFERALDTILSSGADYHEPRAGEQYQIGSLLIDVLNPTRLTGVFHDDGIGVRVQYGDIAILLTGDIERSIEAKMVRDKRPLEAQIFQLGHHGSSTSNTQAFLNVVKPEVAIYSAGADNSYGHPHKEIVDRINSMGIKLYGTDIHGTVIVTTDGKTYSVLTEKTAQLQQPSVVNPSNPAKETSQINPQKPAPITPKGSIDINKATKEELMQIVHIGEERAEELIRLRPYSSIDQLTRINGIAAGRLKDIKEEGKAYVE